MPKVFISHSWEDNEISRKLAEYLKRDGAEVWIDYARIAGGDSLPETISNAIDWCETLVLVWSKSAIDSYWVKEEWTCAHSLRKRIVPCLIDQSKLPSILISRLSIDFNSFDVGYKGLTRALRLIVEPEIIKPKLTIFRSNPQALSVNDARSMVKKYGFFDKRENENGKGFNHQYEQKAINGDEVVIDKAASLMWQQSGSPVTMVLDKAKDCAADLNRNRYAGYNDWRLPTLEEGMSLMEAKKKNDLYINPIFDTKQQWIWTADTIKDESGAWVAGFGYGYCCDFILCNLSYVRAVRSGQPSIE